MTNTITRLTTCAFMLCALSGTALGQAVDLGPATEPLELDYPGQVIEVAIALDTSGSMKSLRDAARLKLWEIVQEIALVEPAPTLRVALLSYGRKDEHKNGWMRVETDLTTDLTWSPSGCSPSIAKAGPSTSRGWCSWPLKNLAGPTRGTP